MRTLLPVYKTGSREDYNKTQLRRCDIEYYKTVLFISRHAPNQHNVEAAFQDICNTFKIPMTNETRKMLDDLIEEYAKN